MAQLPGNCGRLGSKGSPRDAEHRLCAGARAVSDISGLHISLRLPFSQRSIPRSSRARATETPASAWEFPQRQRHKALLTPQIPASPRSARKRHDRPVTPKVAGSSPVAPASPFNPPRASVDRCHVLAVPGASSADPSAGGGVAVAIGDGPQPETRGAAGDCDGCLVFWVNPNAGPLAYLLLRGEGKCGGRKLTRQGRLRSSVRGSSQLFGLCPCPRLRDRHVASSSLVASGPALTSVPCRQKLVPGPGDLPALRRSPRGASTRRLPRSAPMACSSGRGRSAPRLLASQARPWSPRSHRRRRAGGSRFRSRHELLRERTSRTATRQDPSPPSFSSPGRVP